MAVLTRHSVYYSPLCNFPLIAWKYTKNGVLVVKDLHYNPLEDVMFTTLSSTYIHT